MNKESNPSNPPKGHSAVEYMFLVAAVILVILFFLNPFGAFRNTVEWQLNTDVDMIDRMVNEFNILP